jgi:hypothetical protein
MTTQFNPQTDIYLPGNLNDKCKHSAGVLLAELHRFAREFTYDDNYGILSDPRDPRVKEPFDSLWEALVKEEAEFVTRFLQAGIRAIGI